MQNKKRAIFIGATGQNVGKTTLCLGIIAGLKRRYKNVGFIKPVGQEHVTVEGNIVVDKDAALFKQQFNLSSKWNDISPVIVPAGFTRDFIDKKVSEKELLTKIKSSFLHITKDYDYVVVEGTGHIGVGSIINLNNAKVAAALGLDMILIASGGLGSAFDELALNIAMCKEYGVKVRGVILNRVLDSKRDMIFDYFPRVLESMGIPLAGCVPYNAFLNTPTMGDFETLFKTPLLSGEKQHYRHFQNVRLVAGSLESFMEDTAYDELIITPASRHDIVKAVIEKHLKQQNGNSKTFDCGLILTGRRPPEEKLLAKIREVDIPALYAPLCSYDAMKMITSHIAKIQIKDISKINTALNLVESNLNFDFLCL